MKGWEIDNKFVQHRDYSRSSPQVIIMLTNKITQYSQSLWYFSNWKDLKMFVFYCVLFGSFKDEKKLYFRIKSIDKKLCLCLNQAGRNSEADMAAVCTNTVSPDSNFCLFLLYITYQKLGQDLHIYPFIPLTRWEMWHQPPFLVA